MVYNIQEQVEQECTETPTLGREQLENLQMAFDKIAVQLADLAKTFEVYKDVE